MKKINLMRFFEKNPGYSIVLPFLSIFLMLFYLTFFCRGEHIPIATGVLQFDTFTSYVIALLSLLLAGLFMYYKKLCSLQFVIWYIILTAVSFLIVQYLTYLSFTPKTQHSVYWAIIAISSTAAVVKIIYEKFVLKNCWILLLLGIQLLSLFTSSIFLALCSTCMSIGILSSSKSGNPIAKKRGWFTCSSVIVYLIITISYLPYNPMWTLSDIHSIGFSFKPLRSTLIIKENDKYRIYSGQSITKQPITNIEFDNVHKFPTYKMNTFVGLKCKADNNTEYKSDSLDFFNESLYPITVFDSCAFFAADISVFNELSKQLKEPHDIINKNTADLFFKYLNYFNKQDEASHIALKKSHQLLQNELYKCISDSITTAKNITDPTAYLRNISRLISLGLLNACSYDLLHNNDNLSALQLFSVQFLLTFYDNPYIYQGMSFSINNDKIEELSKKNNLTPWTKMSTLCCGIAQKCVLSFTLREIREIRCLINDMNLDSIDKTESKNNDCWDALNNKLNNNDYIFSPMLKQYILNLQTYLFKALENNCMPEFNAFFLNRFNDISKIMILNQQVVNNFKSALNNYNNRIKRDIDSLLNEINLLQAEAEETRKLYERSNNLMQKLDEAIAKDKP